MTNSKYLEDIREEYKKLSRKVDVMDEQIESLRNETAEGVLDKTLENFR